MPSQDLKIWTSSCAEAVIPSWPENASMAKDVVATNQAQFPSEPQHRVAALRPPNLVYDRKTVEAGRSASRAFTLNIPISHGPCKRHSFGERHAFA